MFDPDDLPLTPLGPKAAIVVGDDLSRLSVNDLRDRTAALQAEIARTEAEIAKKQSVSAAAAAFFKQ